MDKYLYRPPKDGAPLYENLAIGYKFISQEPIILYKKWLLNLKGAKKVLGAKVKKSLRRK